MSTQTRLKQERVVEAVRQGLEGDAAVEFIHASGFAMTSRGIARHLKSMGGRAQVEAWLGEGLNNKEVLEAAFPGEDLHDVPVHEPEQPDLFQAENAPAPTSPYPASGFETTKITLKIPNELHHAITFAAKAEGKTRSDLIVEILSTALSNMPQPDGE